MRAILVSFFVEHILLSISHIFQLLRHSSRCVGINRGLCKDGEDIAIGHVGFTHIEILLATANVEFCTDTLTQLIRLSVDTIQCLFEYVLVGVVRISGVSALQAVKAATAQSAPPIFAFR